MEIKDILYFRKIYFVIFIIFNIIKKHVIYDIK